MQPLEKFEKDFIKSAKRYCKKTNVKTFISTFGTFQPIAYRTKYKDLFVTSSQFANVSARRNMVRTLKGINYKRGNSKWTEFNAIPFMQEVITLFTESSETHEEDCKEVSKRYNVPVSRLKTQMALFIYNLDRGVDKFNIMEYFSPMDIIAWKYRDLSKLQEDLDDGKVTKEIVDLIHAYYAI